MSRTPFRLEAPLKDYLWGGTKLKEQYHKTTDLEKVAESWELSCHKDGVSIIADGDYAGYPLTKYIEEKGEGVLGTAASALDTFPILIKLIDAADNLSLQVHPNDKYAYRVEGEPGKTEMWYVIDCEPGAELIYGFRETITKEQFEKAIEDNTILDLVNRVPVKKGDLFFVEAGTLHGIGAGITVAEIQQNSNTTYRIYDYGRVGADGKPRDLHISKAKEVTDLNRKICDTKPRGASVQMDGFTRTELISCPFFTVDHYKMDYGCELFSGESSFQAITMIEGQGAVLYKQETIPVQKGNTVFVPAGIRQYKMKGSGEFLLTRMTEVEKQ